MEIQWSSLFEVLRDSASREITQEAAVLILRLAIEYREGERELLNDMGQEGNRLLESPFTVGIRLLTEACEPGCTGEDWRRSVQQARDRFVEAQELELLRTHSFRKALAEYRAGICSVALGDKPNAEKYFRAAYDSGWKFVIESCDKMASDAAKRKRPTYRPGFLGSLFGAAGAVTRKPPPTPADDLRELVRTEQMVAGFLRSLKLLEGPYKLAMEELTLIKLAALYYENPRQRNFAGLIDWGSGD